MYNTNFSFVGFFLLLLTPAIFMNASLDTPPTKTQKYKAKVTEKIYHEIARTIKDRRKAPTLNFVFNQSTPYYNAYYNPQNNTINFGEGIYDLATSFGKDSLDALAMVIGHELAHFYKDHGWGMSFGMANEDTDIAKKIYNIELDEDVRAKMEAEADYFGGLFGYMAGYNTLEVGAAFYDKLYSTVGLSDSTSGYPTRMDRIEICRNSKKMLKELVPVFKAANLLTLTQQYEKAILCYDHITKVFPSREIYNNAGVAYLAMALDSYQDNEMPYIYPLAIDFDTRMNTNTKGDDESVENLRARVLTLAKEQFEDAIHIDENYTPAYINLSTTLALQGDTEMALAFALKGARLAKNQEKPTLESNAYIVRGIIFAREGKKAEARKAWNLAKSGNALVANLNLKALNNNKIARIFRKKAKPEIEGGEETISDLNISAIEGLFEEQNSDMQASVIERQNENRPETVVVGIEKEDFNAILLATYGKQIGLGEELQGFIFTKKNYSGETARGIMIGSSLKELKGEYGEPTRKLAGLNATFFFYKKSQLIIEINNNKVVSWALYGKVK